MKKIVHFMIFFFVIGFANAQTPIYQFNFDGNLTDQIGSSISLTPTPSSPSYVSDRFGIANGAANFNSVSASANLTSLPVGNGPRSVSFWIKYANIATTTHEVFCYGSANANQAFGIGQWANNASGTGVSKVVNYGWSGSYDISQEISTVPNVWYHYVISTGLTGSFSETKIYRDGVIIKSQTNVNRNTIGTTFYIGKLLDGSGTINAVIDDLKIFNTILSQTQVTTLYSGTTPAVTNTSATAVTNTTATINYNVDAFGQNVSRQLFYNYAGQANTSTTAVPFTNNAPTAYTTDLTGLTQNRRYSCAISVPITGNSSVFPGTGSVTFTTSGSLPVPTVSAVSVGSVTQNSAVLSYNFNPNGSAPSTANVIYKNTVNNSSSTSFGAFEVTGTSATSYSKSFTSLQANTLYSYEIYGNNTSGDSQPITGTFTTASANPAPAITSVTTSNVTFNSASVNFDLNTNNLAATYEVEYGLTSDLLTALGTVTGGPTTNNTPTAIAVNLTGLQYNKGYWVRVRATSTAGVTNYNTSVSFATLNPFVVTNVSSSAINPTGATINYTANSNSFAGTLAIYFQAGNSFNDDNPYTTVYSNASFSNASATNYSFAVTGLNSNTNYSYQIALTGNGAYSIVTVNNGLRTATLGMEDFNSNDLKISFYPNPTKSVLNIEIATELKSVEIYSILGQKVLSATSKTVDVSRLSKGIYMVRVQSVDGVIATQKLMIE